MFVVLRFDDGRVFVEKGSGSAWNTMSWGWVIDDVDCRGVNG